MADTSRLDSFVSASQFCTGSQTDYSTCIANNMKFLDYLDDTYKASNTIGIGLNTNVPYLSGTSYVTCVPLAMADVITRIKRTNDQGLVDFRCSEVFSRPRLPILKLQDLGIEAQDILNITGIDLSDSSGSFFHNIPIDPAMTTTAYYINMINLSIGYSTKIANCLTINKTINGIILGLLDYYSLPAKSNELYDELVLASLIYTEYTRYYELYAASHVASSTFNQIDYHLNLANELLMNINLSILDLVLDTQSNIVTPLSIINNDTDFTSFDFSTTEQVSQDLVLQEDTFKTLFTNLPIAKRLINLLGDPPVFDAYQDLLKNVELQISSLFRVNCSELLGSLDTIYRSTDIASLVLNLELLDYVLLRLKNNKIFFASEIINNSTEPLIVSLAITTELLVDSYTLDFSLGNLIELLNVSELATTTKVTILDTYFTEVGNNLKLVMSKVVTANNKAIGIDTSNETSVSLGGSFKDSGDFYYANLAYAIGNCKLTNLHSIQIDDELYELTDIVDDQGNSISGIADTGCTKYKFTRHVLPTYSVEIEMYVYSGAPNQPYCPTVNRYHNFATSKYSGIFTKLIAATDKVGLFLFKGYRPMNQTVEEVLDLGSLDINAINLNSPTTNVDAYTQLLQTEIKNLTNASTINGSNMTTDDFKYYLNSELVDETKVNNYPGLAIVEFIKFPLGSSFKFPTIKLLTTAVDPIGV